MKEKVVILARVSTQAQDYQRQVTELQEYCDRAGWEVTRVFANKVSGAKAVTERTEIVEMVEYIKSNDVKRVVCLEISRLGRNTLEALKVINYFSSNGVSLYVKNYNLETLVDGKVNPVAILICPLTGHKEVRKAFARYCEIDKDVKRDALKVFEAI